MKLIYAVLVIAVIGIGIAGYLYFGSNSRYPYETVISGVKINSEIPLEEIQNYKTIALLNSSNNAAITCNFELSAISDNNIMGYLVKIENGKNGVYINQRIAYIRGETDDEILNACHAFACLRDGIICPDNLADIRDIILNSDQMNIILDSNVTGKGISAYTEILYALGYLQATLIDYNKDGSIDREEIDKNDIWICPYLKDGETCKSQPCRNIVKILNATNETRNCNIEPGIYIQVSDNNEIRIEGGKIILSGDEDHIHTEAIIVRDILSPKWIRAMYGLD